MAPSYEAEQMRQLRQVIMSTGTGVLLARGPAVVARDGFPPMSAAAPEAGAV